MSARRKLPPEAEAAIINWYAAYRRALNEIKKLGSIGQKAKQHGISPRTLHGIAKREEYELRRKCRESGVACEE